MRVAVHKVHERPATPQVDQLGTDITEQSHVKLHEPTVGPAGDHDIESGSESCIV